MNFMIPYIYIYHSILRIQSLFSICTLCWIFTDILPYLRYIEDFWLYTYEYKRSCYLFMLETMYLLCIKVKWNNLYRIYISWKKRMLPTAADFELRLFYYIFPQCVAMVQLVHGVWHGLTIVTCSKKQCTPQQFVQ